MEDCIFCKIVKNEAKSWKVYEDEKVLAFFDASPVNEYHTLVIPKKHYTNILDIPEDELKNVILTARKIAKDYEEKLNLKNFQIIISNGEAAQQDVFHFHLHIIPRHRGDGQDISFNFHPEYKEKFDVLLKEYKDKS
ncbi:HIT domain-containing protein [Candidatus Pacearchaeota archaeon]|nr:HIT domain-containing protein [Candidatus Pacearchaeota archaeon]